jgi:phospholipase C
MRPFLRTLLALACLLAMAPAAQAGAIKHVIVIAMENTDADEVYGEARHAPYINRQLLPRAAWATAFSDLLELPVRSEPHYLLMEAGTRSFEDHIFDSNDDPSPKNSTASPLHLTRQMLDAGVTWMSYQQAMGSETGACPVTSHHPYAAKHNPFVFFQDIAGNPPDPDNPVCAAHHKSYAALAGDMAKGKLAQYVFITPDLCHDMHDKCGAEGRIASGDAWLSRELPPLLAWAGKNQAVVFIVWDEGHTTRLLPFITAGAGVRKGLRYDGALDHQSLVKSIALIFGLPVLPAVKGAADLSPLFEPGQFP